jgi:hypothetical protein
LVQSQPGLKYQPFHLDALALLEQRLSGKEERVNPVVEQELGGIRSYDPQGAAILEQLIREEEKKWVIPMTEYELGVMHFSFDDPEGGVKWIIRAAENGLAEAKSFLMKLSFRRSFKVIDALLNEGLTIPAVKLNQISPAELVRIAQSKSDSVTKEPEEKETLPQTVVDQDDDWDQGDDKIQAELGSILSDNVEKVFNASVVKVFNASVLKDSEEEETSPQTVVDQDDALAQDDVETLAELGSILSDNVEKVFNASVVKNPEEKETLPQTAAEQDDDWDQDDGKIQAELDRLKLESKKKPPKKKRK